MPKPGIGIIIDAVRGGEAAVKTWRVYRTTAVGRFNVWADHEDTDEPPILVAENVTEGEASDLIRSWTPPRDDEGRPATARALARRLLNDVAWSTLPPVWVEVGGEPEQRIEDYLTELAEWGT